MNFSGDSYEQKLGCKGHIEKLSSCSVLKLSIKLYKKYIESYDMLLSFYYKSHQYNFLTFQNIKLWKYSFLKNKSYCKLFFLISSWLFYHNCKLSQTL